MIISSRYYKYYGIEFDSLEATKEQMKWFYEIEKSRAGIWTAFFLKTIDRWSVQAFCIIYPKHIEKLKLVTAYFPIIGGNE